MSRVIAEYERCLHCDDATTIPCQACDGAEGYWHINARAYRATSGSLRRIADMAGVAVTVDQISGDVIAAPSDYRSFAVMRGVVVWPSEGGLRW